MIRARKLSTTAKPAVSVIVPTTSVSSSRTAKERLDTLRGLAKLEYADYEIIIAMDNAATEADDQSPDFQSIRGDIRTVYAAARTRNAKIDAMQAGLEAARHQLVLFCDDDVGVQPSHLDRLVTLAANGSSLVSAAAIGVSPANLWGHLECSFMNGQFARLHLAGDSIGYSGALGKTLLIRRGDLKASGGLSAAGKDCCEDAALTRNIKRIGRRVVLSDLAVHQFIGRQRLVDVLRRHRRWLSCRRKYLPLVFAVEAACSAMVAVTAGALVAQGVGAHPAVGAFLTAALWCIIDCLFAIRHGYFSLITPAAWLIREAFFLPLWLSALLARTVKWHGRQVPV